MANASSLVDKSTSDLLNGPDWGMNMEICDIINTDPGQARDVVKALKKRLVHKSWKVQLLALTVLEAMMKNCGEIVQQNVAEKDVLPEMVKIVKKKTDMTVREKILVLLDSWQEAFGGISGKYPQYYMAYDELRRSGVEFPKRNAENAAPLYTSPSKHSLSSYSYPYGSPNSLPSSYPNANYGSPNTRPLPPPSFPYPQPPHSLAPSYPNATYGQAAYAPERVENMMHIPAAGEHVWSSKDLDAAQSVLDVLNEMLNAIEPHDKQATKDDLICQLVGQCRSSQNSIMRLVNFTSDDQLLCKALALNDELQHALTKYDAIASGIPVRSEVNAGSANSFAVYDQEDDEAELESSQLARSSRQSYTSARNQESRLLNNAPVALESPPQPIRRLDPPLNANWKKSSDPSGESLQGTSSDMPVPLSSPSNQPSTSLASNPFINAPSFTATPQQYLQDLDYSGYVAPWASARAASGSSKTEDMVDSRNQQQPDSLVGSSKPPQNEVLKGTQPSSAVTTSILPPPPIKHTERNLFFQEHNKQRLGKAKDLSSLEEKTKDLSIGEHRHDRIAQGTPTTNLVHQSPSGVAKGVITSTSPDKLFEDLVDFQSMSPNFKKAGITSSLTRSNKNRASGS